MACSGEYAAQRGVSDAAARKAIATGRTTTLPEGTIDPARAASKWSTQTDPAKQRGMQAAIWTMADTLRDAANGPGTSKATERAVSLVYARMANTFLKTPPAMERL